MGKQGGWIALLILFYLVPASASLFGFAKKPIRHIYKRNSVGPAWNKIATPTIGPTQSIGSYGKGCIRGAQSLPGDGFGYEVMHLERKRNFGNPRLLTFIETMSKKSKDEGLGQLLIGDLGQPRGGPMASAHLSHQIGLDADIWFYQLQDGTFLDLKQREALSAPSMINFQTRKLDPRYWNEGKIRLLQMATTLPGVDRVFVNPIIKFELCKRFQGQKWLQKLRPWTGHFDHFHVRLQCDDTDMCEKEVEIPPGDGCSELPRFKDLPTLGTEDDGPTDIADIMAPIAPFSPPDPPQPSTVSALCRKVLLEP